MIVKAAAGGHNGTVAQEWITPTEAADQLGVSDRTARRWIREGKLRAMLGPSMAGEEYRVDAEHVADAQGIRDIVLSERRLDPAVVAHTLEYYLSQPPSRLSATLRELRAEIRHMAREQRRRERALRGELDALRHELADALEALKSVPLSPIRRRWWRFW